jgi:hypothetical protein
VDENLSLRCPVCRAVDWFRDGFVVVELEEADQIVRRRVMPADPGPRTEMLWSCARCAYEVPDIKRARQAARPGALRHTSSGLDRLRRRRDGRQLSFSSSSALDQGGPRTVG